jgi:hypothetical protein
MKRKPKTKVSKSGTPSKPRSRPTAEEVYIEEHERYVRRVKPNIPYCRKPYYTGFAVKNSTPQWGDVRQSDTEAAIPLLEHGIGCQTIRVPEGKPDEAKAENSVIFTPENNATSHDVLGIIAYVDTMNLSSWGYPDGCTAIHLPDKSSNILMPPFVIHRGRVGQSTNDIGEGTEHTACMSGCMKPDENNFEGRTADVVFFSPGANYMEGVVVASKLSDTIEFFAVYDRVAGCAIAPHFTRLITREMEKRNRYSELHVISKFEKLGDSFDLLRHALSQTRASQAPFIYNQLEQMKTDPDAVIKNGEAFQYGTYGAANQFGEAGNRLIKRVMLSEFLAVVHKFNTIGVISFVVSDPIVLAHPKQIAKMALVFLRNWRSDATKNHQPPTPPAPVPTPAPPPPPPPPPTPSSEVTAAYEADTQPIEEDQDTQEIEHDDNGLIESFIQNVSTEHHPTDEEGVAWNTYATPEDVGRLLHVCESQTALSMASTWIMWRAMSGGVVSSTYNPEIIPISLNDIYDELTHVKHSAMIGDRLFQFIFSGKLFHMLIDSHTSQQKGDAHERLDDDTHPPN